MVYQFPSWRSCNPRHSIVSNTKFVDHVHDLILTNEWIWAKTIAETSKISSKSIYNLWAVGYVETVSQVGAWMFGCQTEMILSGHLQDYFAAFSTIYW